MKKIIIAVLVLCLAVARSFCQFENEEGSRGLHAFLQFGNARIILTNNFIQPQTDHKGMALFTGLPAGNFWYQVTGPRLQLTFHEKAPKQNFEDITALNQVMDTLLKDKNIFAVGNFQYKISFNGKDITGWKTLVKHTVIKIGDFYVNPMYPPEERYPIVDTGMQVKDEVTFEFRDMAKKQLLTLHITRVDVETRPFLASIVHDSSSLHSPDLFIQQQVNEWQKQLPNFTSFYSHWPNGMQLDREMYFASSKLAFWFVKPAHYADSSLEYKLTSEDYPDTNWHESGHLILIPHLQPNNHYTLLVRYKEYPANFETYTFFVPPIWYQKKVFVFFVLYPICFLLLFFATIYVSRLRVKKANERKAKLALELKSIRAQLNPHFVFNALSSIQALINKNDIDLANQYLTDFSNLLRTSLKSHDRDLVPASIDIKTLEHYIKLEQLRFNFKYEIITDGTLNLDSIEIPSLLLQPLVENAIKHGIALLKEEGRLSISYHKNQDTLVIIITDNGKGFNVHETGADQFGLRLTKERIALLNKTFKGQPVTMDIVSINSGTTVTLTFNHWL